MQKADNETASARLPEASALCAPCVFQWRKFDEIVKELLSNDDREIDMDLELE